MSTMIKKKFRIDLLYRISLTGRDYRRRIEKHSIREVRLLVINTQFIVLP